MESWKEYRPKRKQAVSDGRERDRVAKEKNGIGNI
jgi:hypothetical protein